MRKAVMSLAVVAVVVFALPGVARADDLRDTTPPELYLPGDFSEWAWSRDGAYVWWWASAVDYDDRYELGYEDVPVECAPASGTLFPVGETTVECSASDSAGNVASGSFTVTVIGDDTPPTLRLPGPMTVNATSASGAVVWYSAFATDDRDWWVPVTCEPPPLSLFPVGTTTVTCSARDSFGNVARGAFDITVLPPIVATVTVTGGTVDPSSGVATIRGTVECTQGGQPVRHSVETWVTGQVTQRAGRTLIRGHFWLQPVDCSTRTSWVASTRESNGLFVAGNAEVTGWAWPLGGEGSPFEAAIRLRPER